MRQYLFAAGFVLMLSACNNAQAPATTSQNNMADTATEKPNFFPVTAFIKGQVYEMKQKGLNPIKYTTVNDHTDSSFIKFEMLDELLKEFLHPEIDSVNLVPFFTETKFLDQTIDAFTFTYDPKSILPDSIPLKHWDVYIDPSTSKVKRVYMIKKSDGNRTLQLTWQSNQWCKITTLVKDTEGSEKIEKEEKISWDY